MSPHLQGLDGGELRIYSPTTSNHANSWGILRYRRCNQVRLHILLISVLII